MDALHESFEPFEENRPSSERSFGLVVGGALLVLVGIAVLRHRWLNIRGPVAAVAVVLMTAAFAKPTLLAPLNRLWSRLGLAIGAVVNPIVLALIYVIAFVPAGLVARMLGRDPLRLRRDQKETTYWIERPAPPDNHFEHQF